MHTSPTTLLLVVVLTTLTTQLVHGSIARPASHQEFGSRKTQAPVAAAPTATKPTTYIKLNSQRHVAPATAEKALPNHNQKRTNVPTTAATNLISNAPLTTTSATAKNASMFRFAPIASNAAAPPTPTASTGAAKSNHNNNNDVSDSSVASSSHHVSATIMLSSTPDTSSSFFGGQPLNVIDAENDNSQSQPMAESLTSAGHFDAVSISGSINTATQPDYNQMMIAAADDPSAFTPEAQRIKRAYVSTRDGQQYRIQVVKKPSRSGKVNTIHIYPVTKKPSMQHPPQKKRPQPVVASVSHETVHHHSNGNSDSDDDSETFTDMNGEQHQQHATADDADQQSNSNSNGDLGMHIDHSVIENRARRKLEKMLEVSGKYDEMDGGGGGHMENDDHHHHHRDNEHEHKEKIKIKHHHHHHHHNHVKTVIKKEPYPVEKVVEKIVHVPKPYPVEKIVHKPYPVEKIVEKIVHVPKPYPVEKVVEKVVEKLVHVPIEKIVHKPYPVEKIVEKIVHVPKPYPVEKIVEKIVHVPIEKVVHVPQPYPVKEIVEKKVPYPVEKIVHVPKPYPVEKIVEKIVHVPKPYPVYKNVHVPVEVKVPVPYPKPVPYPVEKKVPYPVEVKVEVEKKVPYPVKVFVPYEKKKQNHKQQDNQQQQQQPQLHYHHLHQQNQQPQYDYERHNIFGNNPEDHQHTHDFTDSTYHVDEASSVQRQSVTFAPNHQTHMQQLQKKSTPIMSSALTPSTQQPAIMGLAPSYGEKMLYNLNPKFAAIESDQQVAINTLKQQLLTNEQVRPTQTSAISSPSTNRVPAVAHVKPLQADQQTIVQWQQQQDQNRQQQLMLQQYQQQQLHRQQQQIHQQQQVMQQQQQHIQQHQQQQPNPTKSVQARQYQYYQSHEQHQAHQPQATASNLQPIITAHTNAASAAQPQQYAAQAHAFHFHQQSYGNGDQSPAASQIQPQIYAIAPVAMQAQQQQQQQQSQQTSGFQPIFSSGSDLSGAPPPGYAYTARREFNIDGNDGQQANVAAADGGGGNSEALPEAAAFNGQTTAGNSVQPSSDNIISINSVQPYADVSSADYADNVGVGQMQLMQLEPMVLSSLQSPQGFGMRL